MTPEQIAWYEQWFQSAYYMKLYDHRDLTEARECIDLVVSRTGSDSAAHPTALDLACGPGRHALALARHGFDVTAVDLSPTLLQHAASLADEAGISMTFHQSDMRRIEFIDRFDLVVQLFTSFGYFDSSTDDFAVLKRVRTALHEGGYYALDLINKRKLCKSLVPESVRVVDNVEVKEEREIVGNRVMKKITIHDEERNSKEYLESVRLYTPEEIDTMLREADLRPEFWFGDYEGGAFDVEHSERMLVLSTAV